VEFSLACDGVVELAYVEDWPERAESSTAHAKIRRKKRRLARPIRTSGYEKAVV
jgi:hypothetical protein